MRTARIVVSAAVRRGRSYGIHCSDRGRRAAHSVADEQALEDLEDQGVELLTASDGEEALEVITSAHPSLILLDIMMPKVNGFDVCRAVKHDLGLSDSYVILLTAKGQEFDRERGMEVGANMYMTKPFDPDQLPIACGVNAERKSLEAIAEPLSAVRGAGRLEPKVPRAGTASA